MPEGGEGHPLTSPTSPRPGGLGPDRLPAGRVLSFHHTLPTPGRRLLWAVAVGAVLLVPYTLIALRRHVLLQTSGFDLALFDQYAAGFAAGDLLPPSSVRGPGFVLYGDHMSPVLMLLGPVYAVVPRTETLLVVQAFLAALTTGGLTWFAQRLGVVVGVGLGLAFGLSYGVVGAVAFDFHEIAFALPILTAALIAVVSRRPFLALGLALALLLVKEDLALTTAAVAGVVGLRALPPLRSWPVVGGLPLVRALPPRPPRTVRRPVAIAAGAVIGIAAVWFVVMIAVVIPACNPDGVYPHGGTGRGLVGILTGVGDGWQIKLVTLIGLAVVAGVVPLRSSLLLAAVPALAARLVSDNPFNWAVGFHYDALLMPVVFLALIERLSVRTADQTELEVRRVALGCTAVVAALSLLLGPLAGLTRPTTWSPPPDVVAVRALLDQIPDHATVQTTNRLAAQLSDRTDVSLIGTTTWERPERPDFLITDSADPVTRITRDELAAVLARAPEEGYCLAGEVESVERNVVLYRRC